MELLVVVAIAAVLGALAVASLGGLRSRNLTSGGNLVLGLVGQARQNSVAKNCMTALVLVFNSSSAELNRRTFLLMERTPDSAWTPSSAWMQLPQGVMVDTTGESGFQNLPGLSEPIGPLKYGGTVIPPGALLYQAFLPGGRMVDPGLNPTLRLVRANGAPSDYYDIVFNVLTGIPKVVRP